MAAESMVHLGKMGKLVHDGTAHSRVNILQAQEILLDYSGLFWAITKLASVIPI